MGGQSRFTTEANKGGDVYKTPVEMPSASYRSNTIIIPHFSDQTCKQSDYGPGEFHIVLSLIKS